MGSRFWSCRTRVRGPLCTLHTQTSGRVEGPRLGDLLSRSSRKSGTQVLGVIFLVAWTEEQMSSTIAATGGPRDEKP